ncbi:MAG: hypothetical protein ACI3T9_06160 [Romboutsia timonensis]
MYVENGKYLRLDTTDLYEVNVGGRMHSGLVRDAVDGNNIQVANGTIVKIGLPLADVSLEVKEMIPASDGDGIEELGIVMKPEIVYDESSAKYKQFGYFRNEAGRPVPVIPFHVGDIITLSQDFFPAGDLATLAVGDVYKIKAAGVPGEADQLEAGNAMAGGVEFHVVGIKNSHKAVYVKNDGTRFPAPYKLIELAVVAK